jgi:hypothetical protein
LVTVSFLSLFFDLLGINVSICIHISDGDLDVFEVEEMVEAAEHRYNSAEDEAEGGASHAGPGASQHHVEHDPWHGKCNVEVGCHEFEVLVEVCDLLRGDQDCTARSADEEVRGVNGPLLAWESQQCLRKDFGDHHDGDWPPCADYVDEVGLEDPERHAGRTECVDVREHHFPSFRILVSPKVFSFKHDLKTRVAQHKSAEQ